MRRRPLWPFEASDVPVDPAFRFGRLPNGMRYVIRQNATPKGTALVRMEVSAGSLDESDERARLRAFRRAHGLQRLDPRARGRDDPPARARGPGLRRRHQCLDQLRPHDLQARPAAQRPALLDTALMLMRETASELTLRARGRRARARRGAGRDARPQFLAAAQHRGPDGLLPSRRALCPAAADRHRPRRSTPPRSQASRAFWQREYVPENTTLIVVGDFDARDRSRRRSRRASPTGGTAPADRSPTPARSTSRAQGRHRHLHRSGAVRAGHRLAPRPLARRARHPRPAAREPAAPGRLRRDQPPASSVSRASPTRRSAAPASAPATCSKSGRTTNLIVDTLDGKWRRGLDRRGARIPPRARLRLHRGGSRRAGRQHPHRPARTPPRRPTPAATAR